MRRSIGTVALTTIFAVVAGAGLYYLSFHATGAQEAEAKSETLTYKFADVEPQIDLESRLKSEGIKFEKTSDGSLAYPRELASTVLAIAGEIMKRYYGRPSFQVTDSIKKEEALLRLKKLGAVCESILRGGQPFVACSGVSEEDMTRVLREVTQIR